MNNKSAIVFGITGEQGQYVARGLLADGSYDNIYGVTHSIDNDRVAALEKMLAVPVLPHLNTTDDTDTAADVDDTADVTRNVKKQCIHLLQADVSNATSLQHIFTTPKSSSSIDIFLVTTTDLPPVDSTDASLHDCEEREYQTIQLFFDTLKEVHIRQCNNGDVITRRVVFSTLENVRSLVEWMELHNIPDGLTNIKPLEDGGIVPHFTGKGRGGEYALELLHGVSNPWMGKDLQDSPTAVPSLVPGLSVTCITLPFLHSNFVASAAPLPAVSTRKGEQPTQWSIEACLGDPLHKLDMLSVSDLQYIVPVLFRLCNVYMGRNVRLSAEKITMEEVASQFADLFGKDVIYAPLTLEEMQGMELEGVIPCVESFGQMCVYLSSEYGNRGDVEVTREIMAVVGREPQTFGDWLLTHSDEEAFERVGLTVDGEFDASGLNSNGVVRFVLLSRLIFHHLTYVAFYLFSKTNQLRGSLQCNLHARKIGHQGLVGRQTQRIHCTCLYLQ
jgi:hypothetical protein